MATSDQEEPGASGSHDTEDADGTTPQDWYEAVAAMHPVLRAAEVGTILRMSSATVRRLAEAGEIPGTKLGKEWRFTKQDVLDLLGITLPESDSPESPSP